MATRDASNDLRGDSKKQKTTGSKCSKGRPKRTKASRPADIWLREGLPDVSCSRWRLASEECELTATSVHDGWGLSDNEKGNAIFHGETEHMDAIRDKHNFVELEAHGLAVGLKEGLMGNSEVG